MTKKITIVGQGTAGSLAAAHFLRYSDYEIDWCYDENIPVQTVGEGANIILPESLHNTINFEHTDLDKIDGTFKEGIKKINWNNKDFIHTFPPPFVSYHFNANKLQKLLKESIQQNKRVSQFNKNIQNDRIL